MVGLRHLGAARVALAGMGVIVNQYLFLLTKSNMGAYVLSLVSDGMEMTRTN